MRETYMPLALEHRLTFVALMVANALAASLIGAVIVDRPLVAAVPLVVVTGFLLLVSPVTRTVFVVLGGMAVLQSTDALNLVKVGYLGGVMVAFAAALMHVASLRTTDRFRLAKPVLVASLLLAVLCALSLPVSWTHGISLAAWLRDIAPYALVSVAPLFALDLAGSGRVANVV